MPFALSFSCKQEGPLNGGPLKNMVADPLWARQVKQPEAENMESDQSASTALPNFSQLLVFEQNTGGNCSTVAPLGALLNTQCGHDQSGTGKDGPPHQDRDN